MEVMGFESLEFFKRLGSQLFVYCRGLEQLILLVPSNSTIL